MQTNNELESFIELKYSLKNMSVELLRNLPDAVFDRLYRDILNFSGISVKHGQLFKQPPRTAITREEMIFVIVAYEGRFSNQRPYESLDTYYLRCIKQLLIEYHADIK